MMEFMATLRSRFEMCVEINRTYMKHVLEKWTENEFTFEVLLSHFRRSKNVHEALSQFNKIFY